MASVAAFRLSRRRETQIDPRSTKTMTTIPAKRAGGSREKILGKDGKLSRKHLHDNPQPINIR